MNVVRLLGSTVSFHVQTEHRADNRSSYNQKPKPNRKTDSSVRFGLVLGLNVPRLTGRLGWAWPRRVAVEC